MGRETANRLRGDGHAVIGVDLKDADIVADLSTPRGRQEAADGVLEASGGKLEGAVLAAGLGPSPGRDRSRQIAQVNYLGVVELLVAWRSALSGGAVRSVRLFGAAAPTMMYAASKIAVSRWVRRHAVLPEWAGAGVRLNAIAPGAIMTPLLEEQLSSPMQAKAVRSFPVPVGGFGDVGHVADWMCFMLSDSADFLCGSVVCVDGGTDALFRADDWPRPVPARRLLGYLRRFRS